MKVWERLFLILVVVIGLKTTTYVVAGFAAEAEAQMNCERLYPGGSQKTLDSCVNWFVGD